MLSSAGCILHFAQSELKVCTHNGGFIIFMDGKENQPPKLRFPRASWTRFRMRSAECYIEGCNEADICKVNPYYIHYYETSPYPNN